jgi:SET domain-containing protein
MEQPIQPDVTLADSPIHGTGVFATRDFVKGETVLEIDDSRIVDKDHPLQPELGEFDYHCDYLADGLVILMQSPERHINHSCDPNTYVKTIDGIRHVIAWRDIYNGEEITYDYIINCHDGAVWECNCSSSKCRGTIPSSFFDLPVSLQQVYHPFLDEWFVREHQERIATMLSKLES